MSVKEKSDFIRMNEIQKRNGDIKAFPVITNIISANAGKNNWGKIEMAIDNESVHRIMNNDVIGVLYIISRKEWTEELNTCPNSECDGGEFCIDCHTKNL